MPADVIASTESSRDRGAIGVMMAVLLGTGALIGLLALTVDMGRVYLESRTVQVGADAAADGLAYECALNAAACTSVGNATAFAQGIVNANSSDGASGLEEVCGSTLGGCAALSARSMDCATDATGKAYVRVTTKTSGVSGDLLLTPFTDLLDGSASDGDGVTLWSCAQAQWGKVNLAEIELEVALPPCAFAIGGSAKVVATKDKVAGISCSVTTFSATGVPASTTITDGVSSKGQNAAFWIDLGTGTCTSGSDVTVPATFVTFAKLTDACDGNFFGRLQDYINSGEVVLVGMGWRNSDSTVDLRSFVGVRFRGYCVKEANGGTCRGGAGDGYGDMTGTGWPAKCSEKEPCLYYEYTNAVLPYQEIATTSLSTQPNFGVQTVANMP